MGLVGVTFAGLLARRCLIVFSLVFAKSFVPLFNLLNPAGLQANHTPKGRRGTLYGVIINNAILVISQIEFIFIFIVITAV